MMRIDRVCCCVFLVVVVAEDVVVFGIGGIEQEQRHHYIHVSGNETYITVVVFQRSMAQGL